jgi:hypothetical protein
LFDNRKGDDGKTAKNILRRRVPGTGASGDYKSEYCRGEIFAMVGAGFNHNRITENLSIRGWGLFKRQIVQGLLK